MVISGKLIDIFSREVYDAKVIINEGRIERIERTEQSGVGNFIMPGLIDAHVHIESSMVTPGSFATVAVSRGTIGVVSDPHEIANVVGIEGINFMINDGTGTAEDYHRLILLAQNTVLEKFNIKLELEIELLGKLQA